MPVSASAFINRTVRRPAPAVTAAAPRLNETLQRPARKVPPRYDPVLDARAFVALINEIRREHHLKPLAFRGDLAATALRWSARMASAESIRHNKRFRYEVSGWWLLGENV